MVALDGCVISRSFDGNVEVVEAGPAHRVFPSRVNESLGVCLKIGGDHRVLADGRELLYPENSLCIRPPGCVWSSDGTGAVAFVSMDIDRALLPQELGRSTMLFAPRSVIPSFALLARRMGASAPQYVEETICSVLVALADSNLLDAAETREPAVPRMVTRAREAFEARIATPFSLVALAAELGTNRYTLIRSFKRRLGITPHAFLLKLRVERARRRIAGGANIADVAFELGFADQPHFSRVFKSVVGVNPGAYARSARRVIAQPL